jgi:hypothetical protein
MAKFTFNLLGYSYQSSLRTLRLSYDSAREALENEVERAAESAFAYQQAQEQGAEFVGEKDEEGYTVWDQQDVLNYQHEMAQDALRSLRRAYAISLYHQWERGARAWTEAKKDAKHDELVAAVEALGIRVDPRLHILRMAANVLKHDSDYWGQKLIEADSALIGGVTLKIANVTDWYEAVVISEERVTGFFDAVQASGPTADTSW